MIQLTADTEDCTSGIWGLETYHIQVIATSEFLFSESFIILIHLEKIIHVVFIL